MMFQYKAALLKGVLPSLRINFGKINIMSRFGNEGYHQRLLQSSALDAWRPIHLRNSPPKLTKSRIEVPARLQQYGRSSMITSEYGNSSRIDPILRRAYSYQCAQCPRLLGFQTQLQCQLQERQSKLEKSLIFIEALISESDKNKARQKAIEEENLKLRQRLRVFENLQEETKFAGKKSEKKSQSPEKKQLEGSKIKIQLSASGDPLERENSRLKNQIRELEEQRIMLRRQKDEAIQSQKSTQHIFNTFKVKYMNANSKELSEAKDLGTGPSKQMEEELRQLRQKCSKLETSFKNAAEEFKKDVVEDQKQQLKQQNNTLRKTVKELEELYAVSERKRNQIEIKYRNLQQTEHHKKSQMELIRRKSSEESGELRQKISSLNLQILEWQKLGIDKDQTVSQLQKQSSQKDQQIQTLIQQNYKKDQQLMSYEEEYKVLNAELVKVLKEIQSSKESHLKDIGDFKTTTTNQQKMIEDLKKQFQQEKADFQLTISRQDNKLRQYRENAQILSTKLLEIEVCCQNQINQTEILRQQLQRQKIYSSPSDQKQDDLFNEIIDKQMTISKLSEQNLRLSKLLQTEDFNIVRNSKGRSTLTSEPQNNQDIGALRNSVHELKYENDSLINQVYEKDMKIAELNRKLAKSKVIENLKTAQSEDEMEQ